MPWRARKSLAKALSPRAARRLRRAEAAQAGRRGSVHDAEHQRRLGPDDGEVDLLCAARTQQAVDVLGVDRDVSHFGSRAVPALPGATKTLHTRGDCAIFHASACSRPPPPMTRTFIDLPARLLSVPEVPHAGEHHRHAVLVGGGDDFLVAHRAAGLDHGGDAGSAAASMPSRNGKKASEAMTEPRRSRPASRALIAAMRGESTRLIWPAPTPIVLPSLA